MLPTARNVNAGMEIVTAVTAGRADLSAVDSTYAWIRLFVALVLGTIGSVGMWSFVVALPPVQAEFGIDRAAASTPYTAAMIGFAFGGVVMGRLADRFGIVFPAISGTLLHAGLSSAPAMRRTSGFSSSRTS